MKHSKTIFFIFLTISLVSYFSFLEFRTEIYPFYFWKLFTVPTKPKGTFTDYRLYALKGKDTIRVSYDLNEKYTKFDMNKYIATLSTKAFKDSVQTEKNKQLLKEVVLDYNNDYNEYFIFEEFITANRLLNDFNDYNKKLVYAFKK